MEIHELDNIRRKILLAFKHLNFLKENHSYHINDKTLTCVSTCLDKYKEKFDSNKVSESYAKKNKLKQADVLKEWKAKADEACILGTRVHDFLEKLFNNQEVVPELNQEIAALNYWNSIKDTYIPVLCETKVYSEVLNYAGTFDLLLYDKERKGLVICDYKTNSDLHSVFKDSTLKYPFHILPASNFHCYELQLSFYQIPLEDIGLEIIDRQVIWLKKDTTFEVLPTKDYTGKIRRDLKKSLQQK
jgi:hypothetical protein